MTPATSREDALTPEAAEDRLLLDRMRLAATIVAAGVAAVFVGELVLRPGERPGITIVQVLNFGIMGLLLALLRSPERRTLNLLLGFIGYATTTACTGAVGVIAGDPTSAVIVIVAIALGAATIVPWGAGWQLGGVLVSTGVAIWTVRTLVESPSRFWLQVIGSVLPTLAATVVVARVLGRQRALVVRTEHERNAREARLEEANQRLQHEIDEHRRTEERLRFALRELDHRVKNTLATVQSVAQHTLESSQSREQFAQAFYGRITAMAQIHAALAARKWEGLGLRELIELVVAPYRTNDGSVSITGENAPLPSGLARTLGLALHELATNAAKYGALSTRAGRVTISSSVSGANAERRLLIVWQETAGPPVVELPRRGLGTRLLQEGVAYESGGTVRLTFLEPGVCCEIEVPLPEARDTTTAGRTA